jgi:GMP synthase (glutamine-hydrolysing)
MRILYLLHAPFELPGFIESWASEKGHQQIYVCPFKGEKIPPTSSFDLIIAMGGPQSAVQLDEAPYLKDEIVLIRNAMKAKIPVLGFCLGAQLIGEALGAHAERSPFKEVGVFPITLTEEGMRDLLLANSPHEFPVFHWHNDMPGLTKEAVILAESKGCSRQIIRYSPLAYGFQCHPEMTQQIANELVKNCSNDLLPGKYVQIAEQILGYDYYALNYLRMMQILDNFLEITAHSGLYAKK